MNVGPGRGSRAPPLATPHIVPTYSLIVAGTAHAGKSSLLRLLLDTAPISPHATQAHLDSLARFVRAAHPPAEPRFAECEVEVLWAGERVLLRLVDTPGLDFAPGADDDLERGLRDILALVEDRYVEGARDEATVGESHVHLCLYVLDPANIVPRTAYPPVYRRTSSATSSPSSDPYSPYSPAASLALYPPSLAPAEISAIRRLSSRVNVLPVLGRCDAVGVDRLAEIKRAVRRDLADAGLGFGIFDEDGEAGAAPTALLRQTPASPRVKPDPADPPTESVPLLPFALFAPECYTTPVRGMSKRELVAMYSAAMHCPARHDTGERERDRKHEDHDHQELDRDPKQDDKRFDVHRLDALKGKFVRRFRWGVLDVLEPRHSDFIALRRAAMVHRKVLKTYTKDYLYEKFKVDVVLAGKNQQQQSRLAAPHTPHLHHLSPHAGHAAPPPPHAGAGIMRHAIGNVLPPPPLVAPYTQRPPPPPHAQLPPIVPSQPQHHPGSVHALLNHTHGHDGAHAGAGAVYKREEAWRREREDGRDGEREERGFAGPAAGPGMDGVASGPGVTANGRKRKITMACNFCRSRKLKCDGVRPACAQCVKRGNSCDYQPHAHPMTGAHVGQPWKFKRRDLAGQEEALGARAHEGAEASPGRIVADLAVRRAGMVDHARLARSRDEDVDELDEDAVMSSDDARTVYEGRKRVSVDMLIAETLGDGAAARKAAPPHQQLGHHLHAGEPRYVATEVAPGYGTSEGTWYAETEAGSGMGIIDVGSEGDKKKRLNRQSANYGSKAVACVHCRARKTRCDAARPACGNCARRSLGCSYIHTQPSQPRSKGKKAAAAAAKEEAARQAARANGQGSDAGSGRHANDSDSGARSRSHEHDESGGSQRPASHESTPHHAASEAAPHPHHAAHDPHQHQHAHESLHPHPHPHHESTLHPHPHQHAHESSLRTTTTAAGGHLQMWQRSPSRSPFRPPTTPIRVDDRILEESAVRDRPLSPPPIATLALPPAQGHAISAVRSPPPIATLQKAVYANGSGGAVLANGNGNGTENGSGSGGERSRSGSEGGDEEGVSASPGGKRKAAGAADEEDGRAEKRRKWCEREPEGVSGDECA